MTSLYGLAQRLRVGDNLQLTSKTADVSKQKPKEVTYIEAQEERIRVEAKGPREGLYAFWVESDGTSQVIFIDPEEGEQEQGAVELARLVWPGDRSIST